MIAESHIVNQLAVTIVKSNKSHDNFSLVRAGLNASLYGAFFDKLKQFPKKKTHILGNSCDRKVEDLDCLYDLEPIEFQDEIKWAKAILSRNYDTINDFAALTENYSGALLVGDLQSARQALFTIEQKFGQSLWLIKNKVAFLQLSEGLEAQKKYTQIVKDESSFRGFVAFIAHWVSIRNEDTVTANRFVSQFENLLKRMQLGVGHDYYLRYHILGTEDFRPEDAINILRLEFSRSLIDYYESFLCVSRIILGHDEADFKRHLHYTAKKLSPNITDKRFGIIANFFDLSGSFNMVNPSSIHAYNKYLQGNYVESEEIALGALNDDQCNPALLSIASLANAAINEARNSDAKTPAREHASYQSLKDRLIHNLAVVLNNGSTSASNEINELIKISMNFSPFPFVNTVNVLLNRFSLQETADSTVSNVTTLKSYGFDPFFLPDITKEELLNWYIKQTTESYRNDCAVLYSLARCGKEHMSEGIVSEEAIKILNGFSFYRQTAYNESISEGKELFRGKYPYYRRLGCRLISYSYLRQRNFESLVPFIASLYVKDQTSYVDLPIGETIREVQPGSESWAQVDHLLGLSILLDAYTKHFSNEVESQKAYALEDFLTSLGLSRPSELRPFLANYENDDLVYFFRYICVESIMDLSTAFVGPQDVANERITVCKMLLELDPENADLYNQEINDLVRRGIISKMMTEIDKSRIHIDIPKLKDWANYELQEGYSRYLALLSLGLDSHLLSAREETKAKAAEMEAESLLSMEVPQNEVNTLFKSLISEVRDSYSTNPDFGLERFLSTRIRHGYIESRLRKPVEDNHLITKRVSNSGPYKINEYWIEKNDLKDPFHKRLHRYFSKFSLSYDRLIHEIKSELLQVRRNNDEKGLFTFIIADVEAQLLSTEVTTDTTFKEFLDLAVKLCNDKLTISLNHIRNELNEQAKKSAVSLLDKLQNNIYTIATLYNYNVSEIDTAINNARTEVQKAFDVIIDWFYPSQTVGSTSYDVSVAISVAEAIIKQTTPSFSVVTNFEEGLVINIQGGLPTFIDILVNIFDNVVKRSGLTMPSAEVTIDARTHSKQISIINIKVTNELGPSIDIDSLKQDLVRRKDLLEKGLYKKAISREGGSGLFKIQGSLKDFKIFTTDLESELDFGIERNQYFIHIGLPLNLHDTVI